MTLEDYYCLQQEISTSATNFTSIIEVEGFGMIGDVSLILPQSEEPAELNIMICERQWRGKGIAKIALLMMIYFGKHVLNLNEYCAKILQDNSPSISLFKKIGFEFKRLQESFNEVIYCTTWDSLQVQHESLFCEIDLVPLESAVERRPLASDPKEQGSMEGILLGCCNPILDLSAKVPKEMLIRYNLKENDAILAASEHAALPEEMINNYQILYSAGGSGLNSMRAAQSDLPSKSVVFIGCIGADDEGKIIRQKVAEEGLLDNFQTCPNLSTATCCVLLNGKHRSLVANLAAANSLSKDHFSTETSQQIIRRAKIFYFTGFILTVCPEGVFQVAKHARDSGKTFCFNLSAPFVSQHYMPQIHSLLPDVDFVFGNEDELQAFANANGWKHDKLEDAVVALSQLLLPTGAKYPRTVIITRGCQPTIACHQGGLTTVEVEPIDPALIIDTNGAGDSFCGGFLSQWILGQPLEKCIQHGHRLAGKIIQRDGIFFS